METTANRDPIYRRTPRGARRWLAECERNATYAATADLPTWLRVVIAARVEAARAQQPEGE